MLHLLQRTLTDEDYTALSVMYTRGIVMDFL